MSCCSEGFRSMLFTRSRTNIINFYFQILSLYFQSFSLKISFLLLQFLSVSRFSCHVECFTSSHHQSPEARDPKPTVKDVVHHHNTSPDLISSWREERMTEVYFFVNCSFFTTSIFSAVILATSSGLNNTNNLN